MSGSVSRDQIARLLRETYDRELDGEGGEWNAMADALLAAGLVVPSGLTAEKLRLLEQHLLDIDADSHIDCVPAGYMYRRAVRRELRAWADALSTQET